MCPESDLDNYWSDSRNSGVRSCTITRGRCPYSLVFKIFIFGEIMVEKLQYFFIFFHKSLCLESDLGNYWSDLRNSGVRLCRITRSRCPYSLILKIFNFGVSLCRITRGRCPYSFIFKIFIFDKIIVEKLHYFIIFFHKSLCLESDIGNYWSDLRNSCVRSCRINRAHARIVWFTKFSFLLKWWLKNFVKFHTEIIEFSGTLFLPSGELVSLRYLFAQLCE